MPLHRQGNESPLSPRALHGRFKSGTTRGGGIDRQRALMRAHPIGDVAEAKSVLLIAPAERAAQATHTEAVNINLKSQTPGGWPAKYEVRPRGLCCDCLIEKRRREQR